MKTKRKSKQDTADAQQRIRSDVIQGQNSQVNYTCERVSAVPLHLAPALQGI